MGKCCFKEAPSCSCIRSQLISTQFFGFFSTFVFFLWSLFLWSLFLWSLRITTLRSILQSIRLVLGSVSCFGFSVCWRFTVWLRCISIGSFGFASLLTCVLVVFHGLCPLSKLFL